MEKKRYKKLLMSTGIQRNLAEQLTVWGRQRNIQIDRRALLLDAIRVSIAYFVRNVVFEMCDACTLIEAAALHMATILSDPSNFDVGQFLEGGVPDV